MTCWNRLHLRTGAIRGQKKPVLSLSKGRCPPYPATRLKEAQDTHRLRLGYAGRIFWLVSAWLVCVAVAVYLSGFKLKGFELSSEVLIAFITSTTINVVGLFVVVAKWMFPNGKDKN